MPQSYAKRYQGHEQEILQDIKIHGSYEAMEKWRATLEPWEKYISALKPEATNDQKPEISRPRLRIDTMFSERKTLAENLVEQFTNKVVSLSNRCHEQERRIEFLEDQLSIYKDKNDKELGDKMANALALMR